MERTLQFQLSCMRERLREESLRKQELEREQRIYHQLLQKLLLSSASANDEAEDEEDVLLRFSEEERQVLSALSESSEVGAIINLEAELQSRARKKKAAEEHKQRMKQEERGFSDEEFQTCLRVLNVLDVRFEALKTEARQVRRSKFFQRMLNMRDDGHQLLLMAPTKQELKYVRKTFEDSTQLRKLHYQRTRNMMSLLSERVETLSEEMEDLLALEEAKGVEIPLLTLLPPSSSPSSTSSITARSHEVNEAEREDDEETEQNKQEPEGKQDESHSSDLPHSCGRACMCCKTFFTIVHQFYDKFCPTCASLFWEKRMFRVDLTGRVALVTGGRIKIGYETALILLRCNATVIVTTRFPRDAAIRFAKEKDFANWKNNLRIYRLDMRSLPLVEGFIAFLYRTLSRLDILINNAAQTIARPPEFFSHLHQLEQAPIALLSPAVQSLLSTSKEWNTKAIHSLKEDPSSSLPTQLLPSSVDKEKEAQQKEPKTITKVEDDLVTEWSEPIDLRQTNSWMLRLEQVSTKEFLEVQLVNNVAPFLLTARLKDLMQRSSPLPKKEESRDEDKEENETRGDYHEKEKDNEQNEEDATFWKFIINVSAMEGQFYRYKTERHPHTNMAKVPLSPR
ncbi:Shortchain dehydrogenase, variant 4 [Balamuthia mandrillaris]